MAITEAKDIEAAIPTILNHDSPASSIESLITEARIRSVDSIQKLLPQIRPMYKSYEISLVKTATIFRENWNASRRMNHMLYV